MYPVGAVVLLQFLWEHGLPSPFSLVTLGLFLSLVFLCRCNQRHQDIPTLLPRFFLFNTLDFFRRRYDFFVWGFEATGQQLFQFRLLCVRQRFLDPGAYLVLMSGSLTFAEIEQRRCRFWRAGSEGFLQCKGDGSSGRFQDSFGRGKCVSRSLRQGTPLTKETSRFSSPSSTA